jgi:hypothetical protein
MALAISLLAVLASYFVGSSIFESLPHLEDEFAYVWQAETLASGRLTLDSPELPRHFLIPFVVDYNGQRFGKYPLGWPALLGLGELLGIRGWINPLLAGLGVWLTYRLGKKTLGAIAGLIAAILTATSPFFLLNSGSLLSHPLGLVLSASFALGWLEAFSSSTSENPRKAPLFLSAFSLGGLILTRPLSAIAVALPFAVHGLYLLIRGGRQVRVGLLWFGVAALSLGALHFAWQYAATGDPFINLYTLWWEYDKVGFGPGFGRYGHSLSLARINTEFSLWVGWRDLFGWAAYSWIFLPFGVFAARRNWRALLLGSVYLSLVLVYIAYWVGSWLFGPRYYYEGLYSLALLSAAGIAFLAGWPLRPGQEYVPRQGRGMARPLLVTALVALLIAGNLLFYTPLRLESMSQLYGISAQRLEPFDLPEVKALAPALVVVRADHWTEYANLVPLENSRLNTPFIFVISRGAIEDAKLADAYPDRTVYFYDPDKPYEFVKMVEGDS